MDVEYTITALGLRGDWPSIEICGAPSVRMLENSPIRTNMLHVNGYKDGVVEVISKRHSLLTSTQLIMSSAVHANGTSNEINKGADEAGVPRQQTNGKHSAQQRNGAVPNGTGPQAQDGFRLGDFSIDEGRPMRVIVIGAGISGILAGIR